MSGPQEHKQGTVMVIITPKTKFTGYFFAARRSILLAEKRVRCDGISNSFDALNGLVSNSIPRRCLGRNRVKVTVHVRDLRARSMPTLQVRFKTNNGSYRVWLSKEPLVGTQLLILTPERLDAVRSCHGPRQSYKPALDIVAFSVPRRCLDNPRWIRAQTALLEAQFVEGETTDDLTITEFQDMAGPTGKVPLFVFTKNSTTPKLFRG